MFDENTGKVSTRVNGWQYLRWMSICECINYLVQFFTGRCQGYSFSVKIRCFMDVVIMSQNNPVNDITAHMSVLINDLEKVVATKSSQSLFG